MSLARFVVSTEADHMWKTWLKKLWGEIFDDLKPVQTRSKKQLFIRPIEQKWYKLRVNVIFQILQDYKYTGVLSTAEKKILVNLRDFHYLLTVKDRDILKRVYGYELA